MITLRINNSYSQITGLDSIQHKKLRAILSYDIDSSAAYFSKNHYNTKRYLIDNKGNLPTGLIFKVKDFIKTNALKCSIIDERIKPTKQTNLTGTFKHTPYKAQIEASDCVKYNTATLSLPTGSGKSMVIALIINKLKLKTLIVVPTLELKRQLSDSLTEIFGKTPYITVENVDSPSLSKDGKYEVLILDEAHRAGSATYQKLNKTMWNGIFYRFFLTATAFRSNPNEDILFQAIAGQVRYELSYQEALTSGFVAPIEAYFIELPKVKNDLYTWQEVYSKLVVNNEYRNQKIADLIKHLTTNGYSTLCLVKEVKHGQILSELSGLPFTNGQDDESRVFIKHVSNGSLKGLIGTEGVCAEGIDTRAVEFCVISSLGKAKGAFLQKCGRAIRTYPGKESAKIIIFKDASHKYTLSHFNAQKKILLDYYGVEVIKLDI